MGSILTDDCADKMGLKPNPFKLKMCQSRRSLENCVYSSGEN